MRGSIFLQYVSAKMKNISYILSWFQLVGQTTTTYLHRSMLYCTLYDCTFILNYSATGILLIFVVLFNIFSYSTTQRCIFW